MAQKPVLRKWVCVCNAHEEVHNENEDYNSQQQQELPCLCEVAISRMLPAAAAAASYHLGLAWGALVVAWLAR